MIKKTSNYWSNMRIVVVLTFLLLGGAISGNADADRARMSSADKSVRIDPSGAFTLPGGTQIGRAIQNTDSLPDFRGIWYPKLSYIDVGMWEDDYWKIERSTMTLPTVISDSTLSVGNTVYRIDSSYIYKLAADLYFVSIKRIRSNQLGIYQDSIYLVKYFLNDDCGNTQTEGMRTYEFLSINDSTIMDLTTVLEYSQSFKQRKFTYEGVGHFAQLVTFSKPIYRFQIDCVSTDSIEIQIQFQDSTIAFVPSAAGRSKEVDLREYDKYVYDIRLNIDSPDTKVHWRVSLTELNY